MHPASPLRVLIVDDHAQFRGMLEALLAADERVTVIGSASNGRDAVELADELLPDVVLMDIAMPVMDGFEATRRLSAVHPGIGIVMLTGSQALIDVEQAREAGAVGYVTKAALDALVDAIAMITTDDAELQMGEERIERSQH